MVLALGVVRGFKIQFYVNCKIYEFVIGNATSFLLHYLLIILTDIIFNFSHCTTVKLHDLSYSISLIRYDDKLFINLTSCIYVYIQKKTKLLMYCSHLKIDKRFQRFEGKSSSRFINNLFIQIVYMHQMHIMSKYFDIAPVYICVYTLLYYCE